VEACVQDISSWMQANKLKLNDEKTELLVITSTRQKGNITIPGLKVGSCYITPKQSARNIGIMFDDCMNMEAQIKTICRKAFFHLRNIQSIRRCLTFRATEQLIHAFVTSTLDNGNALLFGLPTSLLSKLQRIQNTAARILTHTPKYDHITPVLQRLHWLPVNRRITFKILLMTWRALNNMAPAYIKDLLIAYIPSRNLRSVSNMLLVVPRTRLKSYGDRAFSVAAPKLWNALPDNIRSAQTLSSFKQKLKTHLFQLNS